MTVKAFKTLKYHNKFLISMFAVLRKAGLPELPPQFKSISDQGLTKTGLTYLIDKLKTDEEKFRREIDENRAAQGNVFTMATVDKMSHAFKHSGVGRGDADEEDLREFKKENKRDKKDKA